MKMKKLKFNLLFILGITIAIIGCDKNDDNIVTENTSVNDKKQVIVLSQDKVDFGLVKSKTGEKEVVITVTNKSKNTIDSLNIKVNTKSFKGAVTVKGGSTKIDPDKSINITLSYNAKDAKSGEYKDGTLTIKPVNGEAVVVPLLVVVEEEKEDLSKNVLTLDIKGLENLGKDYVYEGWIIVDEKPVSTGVLTSVTFPQTFKVDPVKLKKATKFVLTIEPAIDSAPEEPSETKVLAGDFYNNDAKIDSGIIADFSSVSGKYVLGVFTSYAGTNNPSGIWFVDYKKYPDPSSYMSLPKLPKGWKYEGWVEIKGKLFTTGTFRNTDSHDDNHKSEPHRAYYNRYLRRYFSGEGPSSPSEDFVYNAPKGFKFPADLRGEKTFISVEPYPDNDSTRPFIIKPLAHKIPTDAKPIEDIMTMDKGPVTKIVGTVSR